MSASPEAAPTPKIPPRSMRGHSEDLADRSFRYVLVLGLGVALAVLIVLLGFLIFEGWPRLDSRIWQEMPSRLRPETAGAQSAIMGTIWVIAFTALWCLPTGIMAAIYLEEYANPARRINRIIELNIQNLAAVPSIVYGILGLGIFVRELGFGFTILSASLTLSLLVLPTIIIASREAIRAVPNSIRLGSLALGATPWQTIWRQVLPAAIPGIATGSILGLSRAIGEAAPLLLLGAVSFVTFNPTSLDSAYTVLPIQIYNWIAEPEQEFRHLAAAASAVLLVLLLTMNSIAIFVRNRFQKRW